MTVARFVSAANEVTIGGYWREHAKGELKTRRDYEILKFLSLLGEGILGRNIRPRRLSLEPSCTRSACS